MPTQNKNRYLEIYNEYLNIISKIMTNYAELKFYKILFPNDAEINKYKDYGLDMIDYKYRDCFIYLIDYSLRAPSLITTSYTLGS